MPFIRKFINFFKLVYAVFWRVPRDNFPYITAFLATTAALSLMLMVTLADGFYPPPAYEDLTVTKGSLFSVNKKLKGRWDFTVLDAETGEKIRFPGGASGFSSVTYLRKDMEKYIGAPTRIAWLRRPIFINLAGIKRVYDLEFDGVPWIYRPTFERLIKHQERVNVTMRRWFKNLVIYLQILLILQAILFLCSKNRRRLYSDNQT